jgi:hypothetical protein
MSCATTLPGTPLSCDHDEYVRRNVSQWFSAAQGARTPGKIARRRTLFGDFGIAVRVENTNRSGSAFVSGRQSAIS